MNNLLSIQEASGMLRLAVPTLYKYIYQKRIPYIKLGGRVLFDPEKLREWVQNKAVEPITHG